MTSQGMPNASHTCATAPPSISIALPAQLTQQPIAGGLAVQVLVAGQHCAVDDLAWNRDPFKPFLDAVEQVGIGRVAESIGGVDDRGIAGLVRPHALVLEHARIVLNDQVGHDDVANGQSRIQPAGHTGENDCAATESVGQQRGDERGIDLAHTRAGQHHVMPVDRAGDEDRVRCLLAMRVGEDSAEVCEFLRDGADQSDGHTAVCVTARVEQCH